jgi:twitching motility protein PilT
MSVSESHGHAAEPKERLDRLLAEVARLNGSDLHLKAGASPGVRVDGDLRLLPDETPFTEAETETIAREIMPPKAAATFDEQGEVDFAYTLDGGSRFRVNAYRQRGAASLALRLVPANPWTAEQLGLPSTVYELANETRGLVLVTGPAGSGKTTTLATMVDHINRTRPCHVITVEDPIEFLHRDNLARIDQREVGIDTESFASAMRVILRQDPDVILVGEMRDVDTTEAAIRAAETGHLVLSTLHTIDAAETIDRIVDFFAPNHQAQIRISLASSLRGTIAQRLVARSGGVGRLPAVEIMRVTGRVRQFILGKAQDESIEEIIGRGAYDGMLTFDQSLARLFANGSVTLDEALRNASNQHDFQLELEHRGLINRGPIASIGA